MVQLRASLAQGQSSYLDPHPGRCPGWPLGDRLVCGHTTTSYHLGPSLWLITVGTVAVISKPQSRMGHSNTAH